MGQNVFSLDAYNLLNMYESQWEKHFVILNGILGGP